MRIIEVNPEAIDLTEAKIQVDFSEVKIHAVEVNAIKTHTKANVRVIAIKVIITKAIMVYIISHIEICGQYYGQFRGRSCGHGRGNYHGHSCSRSNY